MELSEQERQARSRHPYLQPESCHLVPDQGKRLNRDGMDSMEFQVTGERSPGEHTSLEFEIATLADDGSGFSGDQNQWLHSQVVSLKEM